MEKYDPQVAKQVWERVRHREDEGQLPAVLQQMLGTAVEDGTVCRRLQQKFTGWHREVLGRIAQRKDGCASCLRGILRLHAEQVPPVAATVGAKQPEAALRHCLRNTLQGIRQWNGLSSHPEFGPVFGVLAQQEAELAQWLLQLLGSL